MPLRRPRWKRKGFNWEKNYDSRLLALRRACKIDHLPKYLMQSAALQLVEAYHRGTWRLIWALLIHEVEAAWHWHCADEWEWVRVHVFRRTPNPDITEAVEAAKDIWREVEVDRALTDLSKEL